MLVFIMLLVVLAVWDAKWRRLPHWITLPMIICTVLSAADLPAGHPPNAFLGGTIAFALFLFIYQTGKLGFGDVMLAALIGTAGGIQSGLFALAIGMIGAGIYALIASYTVEQRTIPYGTPLAIGAIIFYSVT